jgi:hypothetical protein
MRTQRRHFLVLEGLDERIVPAAAGLASIHHAAVVQHAAIHAQAQKVHVHPHAHVQVHHSARVHRHRIIPAVQVANGAAARVVTGTPAASRSAQSTPTSTGTSTGSNTTVPTTVTAPKPAPVVATSAPAKPAAPVATDVTAPAASPVGTTNPGDVQNGPLAKAGQDLIALYQQFQAGGTTSTSTGNGAIRIVGTSVGVDIRSAGGDFNSLVAAMTSLGMKVETKSAGQGIIEGLLPIGQLVAAAQNSQVLALSPIYFRKTL